MAELIPVDHDPFAQAAPQGAPTLVPVDHDPFAQPSAAQVSGVPTPPGATRLTVTPQPAPGGFTRPDAINPAVEGMQFFKGFNNTVGNVALGLPPVEAPNAHDVFNRQFVDTVPPPKTIIGKGLERGGDFAASSLPVLGATNLLANTGVRAVETAAPTIANALRGVANNVLNTFAKKPVASTAVDVGTNALAGVGAEAGHESGIPGAETAGAMAAAGAPAIRNFSPTYWASKGAAKVGSGVFDRAGPYVVDKIPGMPKSAVDWAAGKRAAAAEKTVGNEIAPVLKDMGAQAEMRRAADLQEQIPGFNPTLAKASADPVLLQQQAKLEGSASGPTLREWQALHGDNAKAIRDFADTQVPPVGAHPEDAVAKAANNRVNAATGKVEQQVADTTGQIRQTSESLPTVDRAESGTQLRQIRGAEQNAVKRLKDAISAPDTMIRVGDQEMSVKAALDRRAAINQQTRDYQDATARSVEDVRAMRALADERQALDKAIEGVNLPGMTEYRNYYKNEYAPRFLEGASRDVGRYNQFGYDKNKVAAENVPDQFFGPNNVSAAKQFNKLYGDTPEVRQIMTDHALDKLRQEAIDPATGLLREGGVDRWLNRYGRVLNEMPWIRDAIQAKDPAALYGRLGDLKARQAAIGDTTLAKQLGNEPGQMIDKALSDWRVAKTLKSTVTGDPEAEKALTRAVWDRALGSGEKGGALYDAKAIGDFLDKNARSVGVLLTPEHVKSLRTIIDASRIEGRLPAPKGTVPESNAFDNVKQLTGTSVETGLTTMTTLARGRSSPVYEVTRLIGNAYRNFSEKELQAAWKEALTNPLVAKNLEAGISAGKATKMQEEKLRSYLLMLPGDKATDSK